MPQIKNSISGDKDNGNGIVMITTFHEGHLGCQYRGSEVYTVFCPNTVHQTAILKLTAAAIMSYYYFAATPFFSN